MVSLAYSNKSGGQNPLRRGGKKRPAPMGYFGGRIQKALRVGEREIQNDI